jgi:hypothetical protein
MSTILITSLDKFPVDTTGPWNPAAPVQAWHDPQAAAAVGDDPALAELATEYTTWAVDSSGNVTTPTFTTTLGAAAVANLPPAGYTSVPNGPSVIAALNNPPIDLTKMPSGYQIQTPFQMIAFAGANAIPQLIPVTPAAVPVPAGTDPVEAEILADVRDIDKREGGTPV